MMASRQPPAAHASHAERRSPAVLLIILLAFLADRLSKWWAARFLAENGRTPINDWLTITEVYNQGIAFGMFQGIGPFVGWLTMIAVVVLFAYLLIVPRRQWLLRCGLAFIIGGALGNMFDRIVAGQVLDFIETPLRQGVFNVADMMIHIGLALSIAGVLLQGHKRGRQLDPDLESLIGK